jgi:NADP-reducing hydrogenase subunit HndB
MSRLNSVEELTRKRESLKNSQAGQVEIPSIIVGMGTCGQAAGAGEVMQAILKELEKRDLQVEVRSVGCIGMCVKEPLVDIQTPGQPRVTYTNVKTSQVPRLIEEHLLRGQVIQEWTIGFVPDEW